MRQQAKKCTRKELSCLSHWRSRGFKFGINDKVPGSKYTPPSFATRHPILDALAGVAIIFFVVGLCVYWVARGAGLI